MPDALVIIRAIAAGIQHAKNQAEKLGDSIGPREEVFCQFAAAHAVRLVTEAYDAEKKE